MAVKKIDSAHRKYLEDLIATQRDETQRLANKLAIAGTPMSEQVVQLSQKLADLESFRREAGASEKTISTDWEKLQASLASQHHTFQQRLRDVSADKSQSDDDRLATLQAMKSRMLAPLTEKAITQLKSTGVYGEGAIAAFEKTRGRWLTELGATERNIMRQSRTSARQEMEVQTSSRRITPTGDVQSVGFTEQFRYLSDKEAELRSRLQDPDPVKRTMALEQLQDVADKRYRLQVSHTRDVAGGISEATRLAPLETAPGVWQAPALAQQRASAQAGLLQAQQLQAQLKNDLTAAPEQQKTANELLRKMVDQLSRIDSTIKQGQEALKTAQAQSPLTAMLTERQPGEEDAAYAERIAQRSARSRAIAGSIFGAVTTGVQATAAIREMTYDMPRRTIAMDASVEGARQSQFLSSLSFSAENRARFGGNVLFGDRTLGAPGYALASRAAAAELDRRRTAEATSAVGTGLQGAVGIGQALLGIGTIAATGWTGIGGALGVGLMASGLSTTVGALTAGAQNTRVQESGMLDAFGPFSTNAGALRQAQLLQSRDAMMNAAMERNKVNIAAQDAYQSQMDTWAQNIRQTGALAINPADLIGPPLAVDQAAARQAGLRARSRYYLENANVRGLVRTDPVTGRTRAVTSLTGGLDGVRAGGPVDIDLSKADPATAALIQNQAEAANRKDQLQQNVQKQAMDVSNSFFARYGMTAEDWSTKASAFSAQMGTGAMRMAPSARTAAAARVYEMGLAGVGTFEQLSGNTAALANITGRTDATKDLNKVLKDAVKAGFDDSRTGQAFMQNTLQLANALGLRSTESLTGRLGLGARMLGGTEKDMETLTRGMAQVPAMLEQNRVLGGLNFASFVAGGGLELTGPYAQTAFNISKNPERALKVQADVKRLQTKAGKMTGTAEENAVAINKILESQEFQDLDPEVKALFSREGVAGLSKFGNIVGTGLQTLVSMSGVETERDKLLKEISGKGGKLTQKERETYKLRIRNLRDEGRTRLLNVGATEEQAAAAATYAFTADEKQMEVINSIYGSRGNFEAQMEKGKRDAARAAELRRGEIATRAALAGQGLEMGKAKISAADIANMSVGGKIQFAQGKGGEISTERAKALLTEGPKGATTDTEKKFVDWAEKTTKLQASLQQQMLTSLESVLSGKTQQVYVMNWEGMVAATKTYNDLGAPGSPPAPVQK